MFMKRGKQAHVLALKYPLLAKTSLDLRAAGPIPRKIDAELLIHRLYDPMLCFHAVRH